MILYSVISRKNGIRIQNQYSNDHSLKYKNIRNKQKNILRKYDKSLWLNVIRHKIPIYIMIKLEDPNFIKHQKSTEL